MTWREIKIAVEQAGFHALDTYHTFNVTDRWTLALQGDYIVGRVFRESSPSTVWGGFSNLPFFLTERTGISRKNRTPRPLVWSGGLGAKKERGSPLNQNDLMTSDTEKLKWSLNVFLGDLHLFGSLYVARFIVWRAIRRQQKEDVSVSSVSSRCDFFAKSTTGTRRARGIHIESHVKGT